MIDKSEIIEKALNARSHRFISNCYSLDVLDSAKVIFEHGESFAFSIEDHGVNRLFFFVKDQEDLEPIFSSMEKGEYYIEYMTKQPDELVPVKTSVIARMKRMVNKDCRSVFDDLQLMQYKDDSVGEYAGIDDAHEINCLLWSTFHTEISHLLYDDELKEIIKAKKMIIHKAEQIDALLQIDVMPKKLYINQVINKADKSTIHAMLLNELCKYVQNGGRYIYSWVEEGNIASIKFHQKYGMNHDGMWNLVYRLEI
ncbi:MAG: hypothetical protein K6E72_08690 [Saccharofermentans sp.]|nr:hypothetical protein [Saccharofermentans sp.]